MSTIPAKSDKRFIIQVKKVKVEEKTELCESAKVYNITKVGLPNEESKSMP